MAAIKNKHADEFFICGFSGRVFKKGTKTGLLTAFYVWFSGRVWGRHHNRSTNSILCVF